MFYPVKRNNKVVYADPFAQIFGRSYGTFERKFRLPETVKQEAVAASYENGVLVLKLPKNPEAGKPEPRRIKIK